VCREVHGPSLNVACHAAGKLGVDDSRGSTRGQLVGRPVEGQVVDVFVEGSRILQRLRLKVTLESVGISDF